MTVLVTPSAVEMPMQKRTAMVRDEWTGMHTDISCVAYGTHAQDALFAVRQELFRLECLFSRFRADSDVARINLMAGITVVPVSEETYRLIEFALSYAEVSHGAFDITIGPLADLWNIRHATQVPARKDIKCALASVGHHAVELHPDSCAVGLKRKGCMIDLGGIAKGYAGDRCTRLMHDCGVKSAFLSIGGNVMTLGAKPDGQSWRVGIRHPRKPGELLGVVAMHQGSVITSGDYEQYFMDAKGRRWHHIIDPGTGYPARSGVTSATVIHSDGTVADALATMLCISGVRRSKALLATCDGAEVIMVDDRQRIFITRGLADTFQALGDVCPTILDWGGNP